MKQARPVELIQYDQTTGKFSVGKDALVALRSVHTPVAVVAVCGRARQGKSFILNQLLGRTSGFQVAPTHRPCTQGLWMWSAPVPRTGPEGSPYHLVLLDTEGIDAYDQTGQYSTQIFSLAVLLSSLFVFNQMGGIDEAALDRLSLVTEMTKHIRLRSSETDDAPAGELGQFTPSFLWLLRDFYLQLEEDGRRITPRDYLETALRAAPGTSEAAANKNRIRESIKALFPDRDCFTLVRPVNDEGQLARLDGLDPGKLRPEFKSGLDDLTRTIFERARPKQLGSSLVSGPVLAALAEAYVEAINSGAVPTIQTAWQGVAEAECRRAADAATQLFSETLRLDGCDDAAMHGTFSEALAAALAAFAEEAVGDAAVRQAHEARLRAELQRRFETAREAEVHKATEAARSLLDEGRRAIAAADSLDAALRAVSSFTARFLAEARGARAHTLLAEFLTQDVVAGELARRVEQMQRDAERAVEAAREDARRAESKAADAEKKAEESRAARDSAARDREASERGRLAADKALAAARAEADAARRAKEDLRREYESRVASLARDAERQVADERDKAAVSRDLSEAKVLEAREAGHRAQAQADALRAALEAAERREGEATDGRRAAEAAAADLQAALTARGGAEASLRGQAAAAEELLARERGEARERALALQLEKDGETRRRVAAEGALESLRAELAQAREEAARLREEQAAHRKQQRRRVGASPPAAGAGRKRDRSPSLSPGAAGDAFTAALGAPPRGASAGAGAGAGGQGGLFGNLRKSFGGFFKAGEEGAEVPGDVPEGGVESERDSDSEAGDGAAEGGDKGLLRGQDPARMTIQELKNALMSAGFDAEVAEGNMSKLKKAQWVDLFNSLAG